MSKNQTSAIAEELPRDNTGPRSLTRLLAIFDALSGAANGMSLAELSTALGSPKSSLLNLLRPLVAEAYLIHGAGVYRLGPSIFRLAAGVLDSWQLPKIAHPFMEQLARDTGESVLLSVMDMDKGVMTYVDIVHSPHPVRYQIAVGTVRPLYASTAGRLLLAYADESWRKTYLNEVEFAVVTAAPVTRDSLKRDLQLIRKNQLAWSVDGYMVGLSAVAAPLLDADGHCVACFNIAGPTDRFKDDLESIKDAVRQSAAQVSVAIAAANAP